MPPNASKTSEDFIPSRVILFVLFLAMLWGGNAVSLKIGLQEFGPLASAGLRFAIALLLIAIWALVNRVSLKPKPREYLPLFWISALFTVQIVCFNWGTSLTRAGRAALMINTYPLFVVLIAHFVVPGDRLTRWKAVGLVCAFGGVLIVFRDNLTGGASGHLAGDALALFSGFQLGLLMIATKRLVQHIHSYRLLTSQMILGVPVFFILSGILEGKAGYGFSYPALFAVLYQGAVVAGFCFVAWTLVLKHYSPSRLAVLFFTTPLWGITLSHFLLGEPITVGLATGAPLVALGIYTVNRSPGVKK
ncbi:MAG: DMT family transporter [Candidatus Poribacteria bacterium]|nr:DMT family transporter [Candidatus Poribacteria bacterium]